MTHAGPTRRELLRAGVIGAASAVGAVGAAGGVTGVLPRTARAAGESAAAAAGTRQGPTPPLPPVIKVSIAAYSFRQDLDKPGEPGKMSLFDLTDMAARWGLDAIEPTSYYFLKTDREYLVRLKRKIFLAGLEISGTPARNNFCANPGPELDESIAHIREWINHAVVLGSPAIRVFAGKPGGLSREQSFRNLVKNFKEVAAYAGEHGVFLALENHGYMTETADDVIRILDAAGSDWLAANLDTGNFKDRPYEEIARLAPRSVTCQIKASVHEGGKAVPVDMKRVVGILREANYRGYVALEYEGKDPYRDVPLLLQQLQEAIRASA